jgi:hypothetical protein
MAERPRSRAALVFKIVVAAIVVVAAGAGIWILAAATRAQSSMERQVRALVEESAALDPRRPVAGGEAEPGNAWDEYSPALEEIASNPVAAPGNLKMFIGRLRGADRAMVEGDVAVRVKALERLSRGARKAEARPPFRWEGESILPHSGEGALRRLAEIAVCKSRFLREAGDGPAALRLLLDTAQLGRDGACNTCSEFEWEGLQALELALDELERLVLSKALKPAELDLLERALETLDRTFLKDGRCFLNDVAYHGAWLRREDPFLEANETYRKRRPVAPGWHHAFSMRLFKADAFNRWLAAARAHAAAGTSAWEKARGVFDRNANLLESPPENLILNRLSPPSLEVNRTRESQLGLLLLAVHFLRTGETISHVDPFGATESGLRFEVDGNFFRAWSRGPNGVDEGGGEAARPRNSSGSTTIIGPPMGAADDLGIAVER